jgi:hypothetical protein
MLDLYGLKPEAKRKRIIEDFGTFCSLVLAWEARQQQLKGCRESSNSVTIQSSGTKSQRRLSNNHVHATRPVTPQSTTDSESTAVSSPGRGHSGSHSPESIVDENIDYSSGQYCSSTRSIEMNSKD